MSNIPYFEIPEFRDSNAVFDFDRTVFARNLNLRAFMRRCWQAEYPPAQFARMCGPSQQLLKLVLRQNGPDGLSLIYTRPITERPEDFCTALNEPETYAMVRHLTGGAHENN